MRVLVGADTESGYAAGPAGIGDTAREAAGAEGGPLFVNARVDT
ncbi:hypothetical protein GCM10023100_12520 [Actinocorallia cavernae]|uniref:Uncharacterized protein n=2 Tax=Actinomycetes TaxID=1760 RepID=A0ABN3MLF2_9ACTN